MKPTTPINNTTTQPNTATPNARVHPVHPVHSVHRVHSVHLVHSSLPTAYDPQPTALSPVLVHRVHSVHTIHSRPLRPSLSMSVRLTFCAPLPSSAYNCSLAPPGAAGDREILGVTGVLMRQNIRLWPLQQPAILA